MAPVGIAPNLSEQNLRKQVLVKQQVSSKTTLRYLCSRLTWNVAWIFWKAEVNFEFECKVFEASVQGALLAGLCACAAQQETFTEVEILPLELGQNRLGTSTLCNDEEELGQ